PTPHSALRRSLSPLDPLPVLPDAAAGPLRIKLQHEALKRDIPGSQASPGLAVDWDPMARGRHVRVSLHYKRRNAELISCDTNPVSTAGAAWDGSRRSPRVRPGSLPATWVSPAPTPWFSSRPSP